MKWKDKIRKLVHALQSDYHIPEVELSDELRAIAADLTPADGRLPPRPTYGLSVKGVSNEFNLQGKMFWRGVIIETDEEVFSFSSDRGTVNGAEWFAIIDGLNWADGNGYAETIWTESFVAKQWIEKRTFGSALSHFDWPERNRIERTVPMINSLPTHQISLWDRSLWKHPPADFFEQNVLLKQNDYGQPRWRPERDV